MRAAQAVLATLVTTILVSCTTIAPVKVAAGDQCYRCRRTIVDDRLAGEIIGPGGFVEKFRAPGCLAKYLAAHPEDKGTIFVTDFATGKMIPPDRAFYVPVLLDRNTGEWDYRAYRLEVEAAAYAEADHTTTVDWATVLEKARS